MVNAIKNNVFPRRLLFYVYFFTNEYDTFASEKRVLLEHGR